MKRKLAVLVMLFSVVLITTSTMAGQKCSDAEIKLLRASGASDSHIQEICFSPDFPRWGGRHDTVMIFNYKGLYVGPDWPECLLKKYGTSFNTCKRKAIRDRKYKMQYPYKDERSGMRYDASGFDKNGRYRSSKYGDCYGVSRQEFYYCKASVDQATARQDARNLEEWCRTTGPEACKEKKGNAWWWDKKNCNCSCLGTMTSGNICSDPGSRW